MSNLRCCFRVTCMVLSLKSCFSDGYIYVYIQRYVLGRIQSAHHANGPTWQGRGTPPALLAMPLWAFSKSACLIIYIFYGSCLKTPNMGHGHGTSYKFVGWVQFDLFDKFRLKMAMSWIQLNILIPIGKTFSYLSHFFYGYYGKSLSPPSRENFSPFLCHPNGKIFLIRKIIH